MVAIHNNSCYFNNTYETDVATRLCTENSEWSVPNVDDCKTEVLESLESRVTGSINTTALVEYTSELSNLTDTQFSILPQDIITISNILDTVIK